MDAWEVADSDFESTALFIAEILPVTYTDVMLSDVEPYFNWLNQAEQIQKMRIEAARKAATKKKK